MIWLASLVAFAFAHPPHAGECAEILGSSAAVAVLETRLAELDRVAPLVTKLWQDPLVPPRFKRLLKQTLIDGDTRAFALTEARRVGLHPRVQAVFLDARDGYSLVDPERMERIRFTRARRVARWLTGQAPARVPFGNVNSKMPDRDLSEFAGLTSVVLIPNEDIGETVNALCLLFHELAHANFSRMIGRHLDRLLATWPAHLIHRAPDGHVFIDHDLVIFLHERYAQEIEYTLMRATVGRYFEGPPDQYRLLHAVRAFDRVYPLVLARRTVENYEFVSPTINELTQFSLAEVLRGIPFRAERPWPNLGMGRW